MTTIAKLAVQLIADAQNFINVMNETETRTQTWSQNVSKRIQDVGSSITNLGQTSTMYLTLPLAAAGVAAINYASDLEETKSKTSVIFGEMTDAVMKWSENSAIAFGQSQRQALDGASNFALFGNAAGLADDDLFNFAKTNTELASDLASFFNTSPEQAITALGAAYRGESEPIRQYGVLLNEAALQQKALEMGLIDQLGPLTQQQRILAAYEVIMDQTAVAQGDFARTAEGVANQTRIARAQFENAAATLGTQLLPYALQLIQWVSQAITWFQALTPEQQKWILVILAVVAAIGPLLIVVGSLVTAIGAIIGVLGAITAPMLLVIVIVAEIIAIISMLYMMWATNWMGIQDKTASAIAFIKSLFEAAKAGDWYKFGELLRQAWDAAMQVIGPAIEGAWINIKSAFTGLMNKSKDELKKFDWASAGKNVVLGIVNGIVGNVSLVVNAIFAMGDAMMEAIKGFFGIQSPSTLMEDVVGKNLALGVVRGWNRNLMPVAFEPAMGRIPAVVGNQVRGAAGSGGSSSGITLLNYGNISMPSENVNQRDSLLRQLG